MLIIPLEEVQSAWNLASPQFCARLTQECTLVPQSGLKTPASGPGSFQNEKSAGVLKKLDVQVEGGTPHSGSAVGPGLCSAKITPEDDDATKKTKK